MQPGRLRAPLAKRFSGWLQGLLVHAGIAGSPQESAHNTSCRPLLSITRSMPLRCTSDLRSAIGQWVLALNLRCKPTWCQVHSPLCCPTAMRSKKHPEELCPVDKKALERPRGSPPRTFIPYQYSLPADQIKNPALRGPRVASLRPHKSPCCAVGGARQLFIAASL